MTEPQVYFLSYFDSVADDRRGDSTSEAEDYGVWFSKAAAQAKADELNRKTADKKRARQNYEYARNLDAWKARKAEHEALFAAGLREYPYRIEAPVPPSQAGYRKGIVVDGVHLFDYYEVDSYTLNDGGEQHG